LPFSSRARYRCRMISMIDSLENGNEASLIFANAEKYPGK
jgi:hypothetical protein